MTSKIVQKEPRYVSVWLDTALTKEKQKYATTPVVPDLIQGYEMAQAWGYVVTGYSLIEQGLKAVLHSRSIEAPKTHELAILLTKLPIKDQDILRSYYHDFRHAFPGMNSFPLATLDEFLANLDGQRNSDGRCVGSFDWRYFPTEEGSNASIPKVCIDVMHEVAYACVRLIESISNGNNKAGSDTYSWRLRRKRWELQRDWLTVRMNSPGWGQEGDRIEILWGPDYSGRHDYLVFEGDQARSFFALLPDADETKFSMIDKRGELESFNPEEGFRKIGIEWYGRSP